MNCIFDLAGNTLIIVHNSKAPTNEEWFAWVKRMTNRDYRNVLVYSEGGGPTASQRGETKEFWKTQNFFPKFSVVTESTAVRGILTALVWLGVEKTLRPFPPSAMAEALEWIEVSHFERQMVLEKLVNLQIKLKSAQSKVA